MQFSEGRAFETLVKQQAELFVKHVADSRFVQSFAIIKNTGYAEILLLTIFTLELEMDHQVLDVLACVQSRPPHRHPFSYFF